MATDPPAGSRSYRGKQILPLPALVRYGCANAAAKATEPSFSEKLSAFSHWSARLPVSGGKSLWRRHAAGLWGKFKSDTCLSGRQGYRIRHHLNDRGYYFHLFAYLNLKYCL